MRLALSRCRQYAIPPAPSRMAAIAGRREGLLQGCWQRRGSAHTAAVNSLDGLDTPEALLAELLNAAKAGRMDRALALGRARAAASGSGEGPAQLVARECSDRAARSFLDGKEERERGIQLSIAGSTFQMPGRGVVKASHLREGFWLREVSVQHDRADTVFRLSRASLALRGMDDAGSLDALQQKCDAGDSEAIAEVLKVARDFQLQGFAPVVRLQTSRITAVLGGFIGHEFMQQPGALGRCPALFALMRKSGRHFTEAFADSGPLGPLTLPDDAPVDLINLQSLRAWSEERQAAVARQVKIISEMTSEAAISLLATDPMEGLALLSAAEAFYKAECPLVARKAALKVFRATADRLR